MAAPKCKKCKKEVSTEDKKCPHCGVEDPANTALGCGIMVVVLALIVLTLYKCGEASLNNSPQGESSGSVVTTGSTEEAKEAEEKRKKEQAEIIEKEKAAEGAKKEQEAREAEEKKAKAEQDLKEKTEAQNKKDLGITYETLTSRIKANEINNVVKLAPEISTDNTKPNGLKIKNVSLKSDSMAMLAESKENGKLTSIMLMATGNGTASSGADILLGMTIIIQAVDVGLTTKEAGTLIQDKLKLAELKSDGDTHEAVGNGIKYSLSINSMTGVMLIISPE